MDNGLLLGVKMVMPYSRILSFANKERVYLGLFFLSVLHMASIV